MARPIIFFGSSLNPPTLAHQALVKEMIQSFEGKNPRPIIVLAPVYWHIFSKADLAQFKPRLALTKAAFEDVSQDVIVSDIEKIVFDDFKAQNKAGTPGTVDVLEYIKAHPDLFGADVDTSHLSLMLGEDTYNDFLGGKWKNAEKIINLCDEVHAFGRGGDKQKPRDPAEVLASARDQAQPDLDSPDPAKKTAAETRLQKLSAIDQTLSNNAAKFKLHVALDSSLTHVSSTGIRKDQAKLEEGTSENVKNLLKTTYSHVYDSTGAIENQRRVQSSHERNLGLEKELNNRNKNK